MMDEETKAKFLDAMKDPEMSAALEAILVPIVGAAVKAAMETREEEISKLKRELTDTKAKLDELEQYSRKNCLNIAGVPETAGESTSQLVRDLAKSIDVNVQLDDIDACHRIGQKTPGKHRSIIVKFTRFDQRQDVYAARRKLREVAAPAGGPFTTDQLKGIYISDNLTKHRHSILYAARQLKRKGKLYAAWSDVGRMKVRITRGGDTKLINSTDDLRDLIGDDPELSAADNLTAAPEAVADRASSSGRGTTAPAEFQVVSRGKGKGRRGR